MSQPKGDFCSSRFPSIRYTQGKQEGIRMGPDRHLVCWEISLGRSERLPSPLPAPAHQMWGEGRRLPALLCFTVGPAAFCRPRPPLALPSCWTPHAFSIHSTRIFACRHARTLAGVSFFFFCQQASSGRGRGFSSPLLVSSVPVAVEHDPPQVGGHQLLLLVGQTEAGQMQLAGAALREAELPVRDEGLLELVPVLQAARYLGGTARSSQCNKYNMTLFRMYRRILHPGGSSDQQPAL